MAGVEQQESTPQNDSTLGFKWIKKIIEQLRHDQVDEIFPVLKITLP
jgi:hypothetical protein